MSELKAYLCLQAREIENKTFSCYNQTLAVKNAPEATMAEVYLKDDVDAVIAELKQKLVKQATLHVCEMLNRLETPSKKILKLALERDKVYNRCKSLSAEIKEAKEKNQDYTSLSLTAQFNHMDDYKKVLGDQIKKLIDET